VDEGNDASRMAAHSAPTREMPARLLTDIHELLLAGFDGDFSDDDWEHTIGGWHFFVEECGSVVSHASVVPRMLEVDSRPFRAGYVEGVASSPARRGEGFASAIMTAASTHIGSHYEIGALGTDLFSFYERFGWERWMGPTYVRRTDGHFHSEEDDGYVMVLRFGPSANVDLAAPITCEERSGDDW
jgi:aminoglycoside 2'-N-acetyltransferase I